MPRVRIIPLWGIPDMSHRNGNDKGGRPRKEPHETVSPTLVVCFDGVCRAGADARQMIERLFAECLAQGLCKNVAKDLPNK